MCSDLSMLVCRLTAACTALAPLGLIEGCAGAGEAAGVHTRAGECGSTWHLTGWLPCAQASPRGSLEGIAAVLPGGKEEPRRMPEMNAMSIESIMTVRPTEEQQLTSVLA